MVKNALDAIKRSLEVRIDESMKAPVPVRIIQYYAEDNAVSIEGIDKKRLSGVSNGQKFPLANRADESEAISPQTGDRGLLYYSGGQISSGYVMLSHTKGTSMTNRYSPIRSGWAV